MATLGRSAAARRRKPGKPAGSALADFEQVYTGNIEVVMSYFARRCAEPQIVADLTSETFVRAAGAFAGFDPDRGSSRAWLFGIAGHVYARHCEQFASGRDATARYAGRRELHSDEMDELVAKIDDERAGRVLMERYSQLSEPERAAIELVDLAELTPKEAAAGAWRLARRAAQAAVTGSGPA